MRACRPRRVFGDWVFEWYWKQPGVPHVEEFVADIRKRSGGKVPTARTWFGYAAIWTCALAAERRSRSTPVKLAKAIEGLELPPEIALMPNDPFYRVGDHQLMPTLFVGDSQPAPAAAIRRICSRSPQLVKGTDAALAGRADRLQAEVAGLMRSDGRRPPVAAPGVRLAGGRHIDVL